MGTAMAHGSSISGLPRRWQGTVRPRRLLCIDVPGRRQHPVAMAPRKGPHARQAVEAGASAVRSGDHGRCWAGHRAGFGPRLGGMEVGSNGLIFRLLLTCWRVAGFSYLVIFSGDRSSGPKLRIWSVGMAMNFNSRPVWSLIYSSI